MTKDEVLVQVLRPVGKDNLQDVLNYPVSKNTLHKLMDIWAKHCSELAFDAGIRFANGSYPQETKQEFINKHFPE